MDKLDHLGWVVQHTYEIAGARYGIRSTSADLGEALDQVLSAYRSDEAVEPFYSIVFGDERPNDRGFHILYRGSMAVLRSLDLGMVVRGLLSDLQAPLLAQREDALYLRAGVVSLDGVRALVPELLSAAMSSMSRRAERSGVTLPAERWVKVDLQSGRVGPMPQFLQLSDDALDRLVPGSSGSERTERASTGPDGVDVVCVVGAGEDMPAPMSRGMGIGLLAGQTINLSTMGGRALRGLAALVRGARVYQLRYGEPREVLDAMIKAMRSA